MFYINYKFEPRHKWTKGQANSTSRWALAVGSSVSRLPNGHQLQRPDELSDMENIPMSDLDGLWTHLLLYIKCKCAILNCIAVGFAFKKKNLQSATSRLARDLFLLFDSSNKSDGRLARRVYIIQAIYIANLQCTRRMMRSGGGKKKKKTFLCNFPTRLKSARFFHNSLGADANGDSSDLFPKFSDFSTRKSEQRNNETAWARPNYTQNQKKCNTPVPPSDTKQSHRGRNPATISRFKKKKKRKKKGVSDHYRFFERPSHPYAHSPGKLAQ